MVQRKEVSKTKKTSTPKVKRVSPVKKIAKKKVAPKSKKNKNQTKKTVSKKKAPKVEKKKHFLNPKAELLILSPYRFPIHVDTLAIQTARFGGVFFVVAGAILTLFYSNLTFSSINQIALSGSLIQSSETSDMVDDCSKEDSFFVDACKNHVDVTPDVKIKTSTSEVSGISGELEITVETKYAEEVFLSAYFKTKASNIELGRMTQVSDSVWKYTWKTENFDDGDYKLKVHVKNHHTSYEQLDTKYSTIDHHPIFSEDIDVPDSTVADVSGDGVSGGTTLEADDPEIITEIAEKILETKKEDEDSVVDDMDVSVHSNQISPVSKITLLTINVTSADKIKLYAAQESSERVLLGYAYKRDSEHWRYRWDTTKAKNGKYKIYAQVLYDDKEYVSDPLHITIYNADTEIAPVADTDVFKTNAELADPQIKVKLLSSGTVYGKIDAHIEVDNANYVEVYSVSKFSAIRKYLGLARKIDDGLWAYSWNTAGTPNSEVKLAVKVQTKYGIFESLSDYVTVRNTPVVNINEDQKKTVDTLTAIGQSRVVEQKLLTETIKPSIAPEKNVDGGVLATTSIVTEAGNQETIAAEIEEDVFGEFRNQLDAELHRLASAIRSKDSSAVERVKGRIQALKGQILDSQLSQDDTQALTTRIENRLTEAIVRIEKDVETTNKIIVERTQTEASTDSDKDGITDYDEITLYKTDPFSSDSDNDGFVDGVEILNGYDPTNSEPEVAVVFESPKDVGVVREDILQVDSVTTAALDESEDQQPKAIISGKALPNSFVTLYIFSTPVVVTIKTDEEGSWNYRFDKELEDGQHEVYVGVTDNAGKIVAKSNPFVFVKEAEAFTPAPTTVGGVTVVDTQDSSFISSYMIYLVLSISVVAIGLILILLGLHLDTRPRVPVIQKAKESIV